jgi:hypothetical protein
MKQCSLILTSINQKTLKNEKTTKGAGAIAMADRITDAEG